MSSMASSDCRRCCVLWEFSSKADGSADEPIPLASGDYLTRKEGIVWDLHIENGQSADPDIHELDEAQRRVFKRAP